MKSILLILLGCNITSLLMDRVMTAVQFIEMNQPHFNQITWYLSGGIKFEGELSEAHIMQQQLETLIETKQLHTDIDYQYILDEKSKNTAENLYRSSNYINTTLNTYDDIYIITSRFHHDRAKLMMHYIDSSRTYKWILGEMKQHDSYYWEGVHIQNVWKDVEKLGTIEL